MTDSEKLDLLVEKINGLDERVQRLDERFQGLDGKFQGLDEKFQGLDEKFQGLDERFQGLDEKVQSLDGRMESLEREVLDIAEDTRNIKLILDNEIRVNIQRVAEGHLDLSRNLHEAIKSNSELEMLGIRVRRLESDVRELQHKLA